MTKALLCLFLLLICCSVAASTTDSVQYPTAWAFDTTLIGQMRSVNGSIEAAEIIAAEQKAVREKTFNPIFDGAAKPPGNHPNPDDWSRYTVGANSEAITFTIDHPADKDHPKFGLREVVSFYKDGQWVFYRDKKLLIRGRIQPPNDAER